MPKQYGLYGRFFMKRLVSITTLAIFLISSLSLSATTKPKDVYGWDKLPLLDSQQLDNAISLASALAMNGVSKRRNNDMYIFFGC